MYFDTLKVTSIEQSASDVSARGGLHNADLITWKFGKEINIKVTDALYTPASLSLMWGGKFGIKEAEINGFWNPIQYNENEDVEINEYISSDNSQIKEIMQELKKPIQLYQNYLNEIYYFIQTQENFLKPYYFFTFISEDDERKQVILSPNEVFEQIASYVPTNQEEQDKLTNYAKRNLSKEPVSTQVFTRLSFFNGEELISYKDYFKEKSNEYGIYFNENMAKNPEDRYSLTTKEEIDDEYYRLLEYARENFYYLILYFNTFSPFIQKKIINKEIYDYSFLISSCQEVLYGLITKYTDYNLLSAARAKLPIAYLLNNYMVYKNSQNEVSKIYFLIDDNYNIRGDYSYRYTSQYLGYEKEKVKYDYILNINEEPTKYDCSLFQPISKKIGQPAERAKLILKNFEDFNIHIRKKGVNFDGYTLLHELTYNNQIEKDLFYTSEEDLFYDYEWSNCDIQILSLEGIKDSYYMGNIDILYRINGSTLDKKILIRKHGEEEYTSQINIYSNDIKVGTFYINDSFNFNTHVENSIYPIKNGISEAHVLDKMEKCKADFTFCIDTDKNLNSDIKKNLSKYAKTNITIYYDPKTMKPYQPNSTVYTKQNGQKIYGNLKIFKKGEIFYKWTRTTANEIEIVGQQINVTANDFPGHYRLVGHTKTRARLNGEDSYLQFEIPLCSVNSSAALELSADGEPTTFSMDLKVLADKNGDMIKFIKYDAQKVDHNGREIIPEHGQYVNTFCEQCNIPEITFRREGDENYQIIMPLPDSYYCFNLDCQAPFNGKDSYLILPKTNKLSLEIEELYNKYKEALELPETNLNKQNLIKHWRKELDKYRDVLMVYATTQETWIYIEDTRYKVARYENYQGKSDTKLNRTNEIDGKVYYHEYITQENFAGYSPLTFTLKNESLADNITEVGG